MRNLGKLFRLFTLMLVASVALTSCGLSTIDEKISLGGLESVELKGLTGLQIEVSVDNKSRYTLELDESVVEVLSAGRQVAKLTQVGSAVIHKKSDKTVKSIWRISGINPIAMLTTFSQIKSGKAEEFTVNYSTRVSTKGINKKFSQNDVDLTKFINTFADKGGL